MKLLIVAQTLDSNHSVLGFFVRWVLEFAKQCEQVTVLCLDKGKDVFPENVTVVHVPRTWHGVKTWPLTLAYKAFVHKDKYTHVFVHMNPEYILSAGLIWKILGKKINFWYAHGAVTLRMKIATLFSKNVFSSTREGFRYKTKKLHIVGQGVDTSLYTGVVTERELQKPIRIASIGRTSISKRLEFLLETISLLKSKYNTETICTIIGGPVTEKDVDYEKSLKDLIIKNNLQNNIVWKGPLPLTQAIEILKTQDVFLHFGNTGSLDKAVLDTMMCGVIPMSTNEAVKNILDDVSAGFLCIQNVENAAHKVYELTQFTKEGITTLRSDVKTYVEEKFSLKNLVQRIIDKIL